MNSICLDRKKDDDKTYIKLLKLWHTRLLSQYPPINSSTKLSLENNESMLFIEEPLTMITESEFIDSKHQTMAEQRKKPKKRKFFNLTKNIQKQCIKDLETMSSLEVAEKYSISPACLLKWQNNHNETKQMLTTEMEIQLLLWYFDSRGKNGYVTISQFRNKAIEYSTINDFTCSIKWIVNFNKKYSNLNISLQAD